MLIDLYELATKIENVYIKLPKEVINLIKTEIKIRYNSISNYARAYNWKNKSLSIFLNRYEYFSIKRLNSILDNLDLSKKDIFDKTISFRMHGSHVETFIPHFLELNEETAYYLGLYAAEGDTGFNGKTKPSKLRFTNSCLTIVKFYKNKFLIKILKQEANSIKYYINIPKNEEIDFKIWESRLQIKSKNIHIYKDKHATISRVRVACEKKIILEIILELIKIVKNVGADNINLAKSYVQGLFDGEGTAYCKRMKYIRIEMKNKNEMEFVLNCLIKLGINTKLKERATRKGMYTIMISKYKNVLKFNENIGFHLNYERQTIVNNILNYYSIHPELTQ